LVREDCWGVFRACVFLGGINNREKTIGIYTSSELMGVEYG